MSPRPEWFAHLRVGDVLQRGRGPYRIVRHVTRRENGSLVAVTFSKQRRSRYMRCDTVYFATDLKTMGFRYVGARVALTSEMDRRIAEAIESKAPVPNLPLTQDDVVGVVAA